MKKTFFTSTLSSTIENPPKVNLIYPIYRYCFKNGRFTKTKIIRSLQSVIKKPPDLSLGCYQQPEIMLFLGDIFRSINVRCYQQLIPIVWENEIEVINLGAELEK